MFGDNDPSGKANDRALLGPVPQQSAVARSTIYNVAWSEDVPGGGIDIVRYWRMLVKRRWVIIASIVGCSVVGLAVTLLTTPIFHAEATVKIDRESAKIVNVEDVEPRETVGANEEFFQTQYGLLKSRALATGVVDRLGLASSEAFFKAMGARLPNPGLTDKRRAATDVFQDNLDITPVRGSRLVKVGFNSPDPKLAATIVNTTVEEFIASNLNRRYESSDYARQFLEAKLAEAKAKLESSERAAADYAARERIINVAPDSDERQSTQSLEVTSLVAVNQGLATARGERIKAEQRWRQSQTAAAASLPEVLGNPTIQELNQTRAKLQAEYEDKLKIYKPGYPDLVGLKSRISALDQQIQQEMRNIQNSLKLSFEVAQSQERAFEEQVRRLQGATLDMGQRGIQYGILMREADTNRTIYEGLLQRYKEIGVAGGISTNNISIVDRAEPPPKPAKPNGLLNMALAVVAGLAFGVVLSLALELMDESIATPEDIEGKLGLPLLGSVPKLLKGQAPGDALADIRSAFSEAYYSIRTGLQFSTPQGAPSSLLVTSSRPAEGKSTTALAIAKNFARVGVRVLLVDGDMRNPSMHRHLGTDNAQGLSNVLTGGMRVDAALSTDTPNLSFIPCGPLPPNPAELLASDSLKRFIDEALTIFDMIVIDGPPVLGLADAPTLAASVAGTVFVVESRGTRRGLARTAVQRLQLGHARLLGGILTKFDVKKTAYGAGYAYAYDYSYGPQPSVPAK